VTDATAAIPAAITVASSVDKTTTPFAFLRRGKPPGRSAA
jgi:hypothetical protein